ncbi:predicted protein [Postia placenta Mad-698-R]|uniref:Ino eighty subunit 1 n=1 Tax=Postia placenta MAD-698-R-SB12 TaxID=670580 RepID=A0A1X6NGS3_9APHY|nr:hypothetical protein POSPLADRAFT_1042908 [Postia placenta MAD-698-R-SB12]EED81243.1 predicted protein [Postia placenta Mad-698-R]OSX67712.1 hypothetical protein POSPLADRAFT_1042908 [Postia placenta MAD-698-R-SB12]
MPNTARSFAVKHSDGEPLTRADLQYDLLHHIFSNTQAVFSDPYRTLNGAPAGTKVTFRELYINSLLHSPRCSKASRDKIIESPAFGIEFSKMSLLSNVGRINTTMAFFPEMRTALRTYHPVPSLQKTNGNLQDAPRIKNILKSCYLDNEINGIILSPADILSRARAGQVPPTTIVNILFTFSTHAPYSSETRAHAFLWLCYHYHEAPSFNPFSDDHANAHPGHIPALRELLPEEAALENVDPPDERDWGERMTQQRRDFMESKSREEELDPSHEERPKPRGNAARNRARTRATMREMASVAGPEPAAGVAELDREASPAETQDVVSPLQDVHREAPEARATRVGVFKTEESGQPPVWALPPPSPVTPWDIPSPPSPPARWGHHRLAPRAARHYPSPPRRPPPSPPPRLPSIPDLLASPRECAEPYPRPRHARPSAEYFPTHGRPTRTRDVPVPTPYLGSPYQYPPYIHPSRLHPAFIPAPPPPPPPPPIPRRSMLEQAWHVMMSTDPLLDSDNEEADEDKRLDYILRLRIISRLRGKEPTPEPEAIPPFVPVIHNNARLYTATA